MEAATKSNPDEYGAKFIDGTSSHGDYAVFGYSEDHRFMIGIKPLIGFGPEAIKLAARVRAVPNPDHESPLLSTQDGVLIVEAFPDCPFDKRDASRASFVVEEMIEREPDVEATVDKALDGLFEGFGKMIPVPKDTEKVRRYVRESYLMMLDGSYGFTWKKGQGASAESSATVSHINLPKKADAPADDKPVTDAPTEAKYTEADKEKQPEQATETKKAIDDTPDEAPLKDFPGKVDDTGQKDPLSSMLGGAPKDGG